MDRVMLMLICLLSLVFVSLERIEGLIEDGKEVKDMTNIVDAVVIDSDGDNDDSGSDIASYYDACWRKAMLRGPGKHPDITGKCPSNMVKSEKKCYKPCPKGYIGMSSLCWELCKKPFLFDGLIFCCKSKDICQKHLKDLKTIPKTIRKAEADVNMGKPISIVLNDLHELFEQVQSLSFPICTKSKLDLSALLSSDEIIANNDDDGNDDEPIVIEELSNSLRMETD